MIPRLDSWTSACQNLCQGFHEPFRTLKHRENQGLCMAARLKPTLRAKNRVVVSNQKSTSTLALQKPEQSPALGAPLPTTPSRGAQEWAVQVAWEEYTLGLRNGKEVESMVLPSFSKGLPSLRKFEAHIPNITEEQNWICQKKHSAKQKIQFPSGKKGSLPTLYLQLHPTFNSTKQELIEITSFNLVPIFDPLSLWGSYPAFVIPRCPQCSDPQVEMWFDAIPRHHHNDILNTGNLGNVWKLMPIHVCMHAHTNIRTFNRRTNIQMYRGTCIRAYMHTQIRF